MNGFIWVLVIKAQSVDFSIKLCNFKTRLFCFSAVWPEVSPLTTHFLLSELGVWNVTVCVHSVSWAQPTAAAAKLLQLCPTLCDPIDGSPPGSPVPGILQARTLELVAISFSNAWKWKVKEKSLSGAWLLATPWTAAYQVPPSMGFSRQEYWSRVPLPSPDNLASPD